METIIDNQSPLATYLTANGQSDDETNLQVTHGLDGVGLPPTVPTIHQTAPTPLRHIVISAQSKRWISRWASGMRKAYGLLLSSTLGKADNERFLEHFRYIIIASPLLSEHLNTSAPRIYPKPEDKLPILLAPINPATILGVIVSLAVAFVEVWLLDQVRHELSSPLNITRVILLCSLQAGLFTLLYGFMRRHWLKYIRVQAVHVATGFVEEVYSLETSLASTLRHVQEIELVSKGYQLSSPLPPVSRLEQHYEVRNCPRIRRTLQMIYHTAIPAFRDAVGILKLHAVDNELERFLEVYDVHDVEGHKTFDAQPHADLAEQELLAYLRAQHHRLATLRRILMCCLLSVPATGTRADAIRWRAVVTQLYGLTTLISPLAQDLLSAQQEEDSLLRPDSPQATTDSLPSSFNPHLSAVSLSLRTMHAKLHLMRAEAARLTSTSPAKFSSISFRNDYKALGDELNNIRKIWEEGLAAVDDGITVMEKNSGHGNPGLGVSFEGDEGGNSLPRASPDGLRLLSGRLPASPPLSAVSGSGDELQDERRGAHTPQAEEREIFEAVALPIRRISLSKEYRLRRAQEEKERFAKAREQRAANTSMIKELQTVINLRPQFATRRSLGKESPPTL